MPIRPDLRHHYRGPSWIATRARILARAGGAFKGAQYIGRAKCEQCGVPDHAKVLRWRGYWADPNSLAWRDELGRHIDGYHAAFCETRSKRIILTVAHLNHTPGDDRDDNLKALCQWCHLNYDKLHHAETRSTRKDATRPLLAETMEARG